MDRVILRHPKPPSITDGWDDIDTFKATFGYKSTQTVHNFCQRGMPFIKFGPQRFSTEKPCAPGFWRSKEAWSRESLVGRARHEI
jgi:hypothetical protein